LRLPAANGLEEFPGVTKKAKRTDIHAVIFLAATTEPGTVITNCVLGHFGVRLLHHQQVMRVKLLQFGPTATNNLRDRRILNILKDAVHVVVCYSGCRPIGNLRQLVSQDSPSHRGFALDPAAASRLSQGPPRFSSCTREYNLGSFSLH
jgi:hypothetical protein